MKYVLHNLLDPQSQHDITQADAFTKVLGVDWNAKTDSFRPTMWSFSSDRKLTKRALASDIATIFDVMGWCSLCIIRPNVLLQRLLESGLAWDDSVPTEIHSVWERWHSELPKLRNLIIPLCYFPAGIAVKLLQLRGFSDALEVAYAGVVYLRIVDCNDSVTTSLVITQR